MITADIIYRYRLFIKEINNIYPDIFYLNYLKKYDISKNSHSYDARFTNDGKSL